MPIGMPLLFVLFGSQVSERKVDVLVEEERSGEAAANSSSFTQAEIQVRTRPEGNSEATKVLEMVPSAVVTQSGGGGVASVSLLGAPSQATLVVAEGVVLNDSSQSSGGFDFSLLHLDPLSELVVVPGPASVVYRNGGLGGVIEVRPLPLADDFSFAGKLEAGFGRSKTLSLASGYATDASQLSGWASVSEVGGQSAASSWRGNTEDDVQQTTQGRLNYSYKLSSRASFDTGIRYVLRNAELDAFGGPHGDDPNFNSRTQLLHTYVRPRYLVSEFYRQALTLSFAQTKRWTKDDEDTKHVGQSASYDYLSQTLSVDWMHEVVLSDALTLKSGVGVAQEGMKADEESSFMGSSQQSDLNKKRMPIWLYSELEHSFFEKQRGRIGARLETLKETATKSVSAFESIPTSQNLRLEMSVGYNERLPTFYQLYSDYGTENLQTERSVAGVMGVVMGSEKSSFSVQSYVTEFRNLVEYDTSTSRFRNIGRAETYGVSAEMKSTVRRAVSTLQYSYLKASDLTAHKKMNLRPRHRVNMRLESDDSLNLRSYLMMRYTSEQNDFGNKTLPSRYLWEIGANYWLNNEMSVYTRVENLSNVRYETSYGYAGEPRTLYIGATAKL